MPAGENRGFRFGSPPAGQVLFLCHQGEMAHGDSHVNILYPDFTEKAVVEFIFLQVEQLL
ncbi:MAG: hypothetical protein R6U08_00320 [Bacillota bacterium]